MMLRVWNWRDEYNLLVRLGPDVFEDYVTTSLARRLDFTGRPTTPEWGARYLEITAKARRQRERVMA